MPAAAPDVPGSYPRLAARTRNFTLGRPRDIAVVDGGRRVLFLRSRAGDDPHTCLWSHDVATGEELLIADPAVLVGADPTELPPEERARRERARETAGGIVRFATDRTGGTVVVPLAGRVFVVAARTGTSRELPTPGPVVDPRLDPTGTWVSYVSAGEVYVTAADGSGEPRRLLGSDVDGVNWGLAEFVAAEEMGRDRGYWWSPDGTALLVARVDERPVATWWISDPAHPEAAPRPLRYPAAGTANADVSLVIARLDGEVIEVDWDRRALPYLVTVRWPDGHDPLLVVEQRDQRRLLVLAVDPGTGTTSIVRDETAGHWCWPAPGVPDRLADGRLVTTADSAGWHRLVVGDQPVTPEGLELREVVHVGTDEVLFTASADPVEVHVWRWSAAGLEQLTEAAGVHTARAGGDTVVLASSGLDADGITHEIRVRGRPVRQLASYAAVPDLVPQVRLLTVGERALRAGLVLPRDHRPGRRLPVLLDPYAGPGHQRVLAARAAWRTSQWFADQGFAVLVVDGRGTPGRGSDWQHAIAGDFAGPVLDDQVSALHAVAAQEPDLDLDRVAIRGWSFGGYLAALAVLRRPDVFHAAVAGAPVTDWRLYDTHYTERYLGHPDTAGAAYDASSLLADAPRLSRPLLLIHGLADDNVVPAHTFQLSARLLAAGRPHTFLPLLGVTHLASAEEVAENLLWIQVEFLQRTLSAR